MRNKKTTIDKLRNKSVLIWGARMTGLGALRLLKQQNISVVGFIDSDKAFKDKKVSGLKVNTPDEIKTIKENIPNLAILIAVSLKEDEINSQLIKMNLGSIPVISFQDDSSPYYTIDILSSCNLKCGSCPHSIEGNNVPKGSMTLDTFKKVLDKITNETPTVSHISLYSWGEPLLHPYLDEIVSYVHSKGIAVALSSNLSINFQDRLEDLVKKNPDYLKISVSGFYPKAYNSTHQGGDINLVKSNLYRLKFLIDKYKCTTLVDINYHLYRDNCSDNLNKFRDLASELGFIISETYALVMPLERVISHLDGNPDFQTTILEDNLLVTIDEGVAASKKFKLPKDTCPFRENQVNINADLSVPVCCTVFQRENNIVAQNYLESSIEEINAHKKSVSTCIKCMELALPEYNMGFNRQGWEVFANEKTLRDEGILGK